MRALVDDVAEQAPSLQTASLVGDLTQIVTFSCEQHLYGLDIMSVREIRSWSATTGLPGQARGGRGILDIRGEVVEVFDLAEVLGHMRRERPTGEVIIVVTIEDVTLGLVVDSVSDLIEARPDLLRKVPPSRGGDQPVSVLVKHDDLLIGVLDLHTVFPWLMKDQVYTIADRIGRAAREAQHGLHKLN